MTANSKNHYQLIGIGIGLFNLSLASLLKKAVGVESLFFDRKPRFDWHSEIMFADSEMQTSYLKDLVTPADPTNPSSFLNYLVQKGLFYSFINTNRKSITRREFEMYCQWVSENLSDQLRFGCDIQSVEFDGQHFVIQVNGQIYTSDHICIGTGLSPRIPAFAEDFIGPDIFHAKSSYLKILDASNKDIVVVGGGQTGIEIFRNCMNGKWGPPKSVKLISSRASLEPLDNSPFVNEYFTPSYVRDFLKLDQSMKDPIVTYQKLASDGNTPEYLELLYNDLYQKRHVQQDPREFNILPYRRLENIAAREGRYQLSVRNAFTQKTETHQADSVILGTGFQTVIPDLIAPLRPLIQFDDDGRFKIKENFHVDWSGPAKNKIYAVNFSRHGHGISEPQTSLMAWRSAKIINDLTQQPIFPLNSTVSNFVTYT